LLYALPEGCAATLAEGVVGLNRDLRVLRSFGAAFCGFGGDAGGTPSVARRYNFSWVNSVAERGDWELDLLDMAALLVRSLLGLGCLTPFGSIAE
jgi:hypothetical protein